MVEGWQTEREVVGRGQFKCTVARVWRLLAGRGARDESGYKTLPSKAATRAWLG
jgi:hypothetical protein